MQNDTQQTAGVTFIDLLSLAFIVLRLCNVIKWNWIWVLSPLWIIYLLNLIMRIIVETTDDM